MKNVLKEKVSNRQKNDKIKDKNNIKFNKKIDYEYMHDKRSK